VPFRADPVPHIYMELERKDTVPYLN
jgi:hypothetical protein